MVARSVPKDIVDLLESIKVDHEHRNATRRRAVAHHQGQRVVEQRGPVGQTSESVVMRSMTHQGSQILLGVAGAFMQPPVHDTADARGSEEARVDQGPFPRALPSVVVVVDGARVHSAGNAVMEKYDGDGQPEWHPVLIE